MPFPDQNMKKQSEIFFKNICLDVKIFYLYIFLGFLEDDDSWLNKSVRAYFFKLM